MMISAAVLLADGIRKFPFATQMILLILGMTGWEYWDAPYMSRLIRLTVIVVMGINVMTWYIPKLNRKPITRGIIGFLLVLAIAGNLLAIRRAPKAACGDYGCLIPEKISLQAP
jgi:hypothetical protein